MKAQRTIFSILAYHPQPVAIVSTPYFFDGSLWQTLLLMATSTIVPYIYSAVAQLAFVSLTVLPATIAPRAS